MRTAALTLIVAISSSLGGCYLGRTPGRKAVAYAANGALVVAAAGGISNASQQHDDAQLTSEIMLVPLLAGLIGIAYNLAVPTETAAPPPPLQPVASARPRLDVSHVQLAVP
jgi:hypothetical protein